jgi:hypothetical protein
MTRRKENLRLMGVLVLLILVAGALHFARDTTRPSRGYSVQLEEPETVTRILLTSSADTVNLSFSGSWRVNGSQEADRDLIRILFATLQQLQAKRPVADSQADSVSTLLNTLGTRVEVFSGDDLQTRLTIGGNSLQTETYVMRDGMQPYLAVIPGYRVYAAGIFELTSVEWRDKRVFNFNWRNFAGLKITKREESLNITAGDQGILVDGSPKADTAVLNTFLDAVSLLRVERFLKPGEYTAHLPALERGAEALFEVTDIAGNVFQLEVFRSEGGLYLARIDGRHLAEMDDAAVKEISISRKAIIAK